MNICDESLKPAILTLILELEYINVDKLLKINQNVVLANDRSPAKYNDDFIKAQDIPLFSFSNTDGSKHLKDAKETAKSSTTYATSV